MDRPQMIDRAFGEERPWDMLVIGGGATGAGIAVDASSRGYRVLLLEQNDFGKGTSSRSTKLIHGGVRYLQQGSIALVMGALKERGLLRRNAPHLVSDLAFVVPSYDWWESPFYGIGLKMYDLLAGKYGFGKSRLLSKDAVLKRIATLERQGLRGGVLYYDGQFDDARLLINLMQTAAEHGAVVLNYMKVTALCRDEAGIITGAVAVDEESGREISIAAKVVINATGPFADQVRRMDDEQAEAMIAPSQGVHVVLDGSFLGGDTAIMVPRTSDKRVMFAIPWHGQVLVGTTDTPIEHVTLEPRAMEEEIAFILETAGQYLQRKPTHADVRSVFAGIRPLVKSNGTGTTAALSRDHTIHISSSGLLTIAGGKWTTYRHMAEDCVNHAAMLGQLDERDCITAKLIIHGGRNITAKSNDDLAIYGEDAPAIAQLMRSHIRYARPLHAALPIVAAQVIWAVRHEMARTVEDVLARRTRALLLNAQAAIDMAPMVARLMAETLGRDASWQARQVKEFVNLARGYQTVT